MDGYVREIDKAKLRLWWNRLKYPALILLLGIGLMLLPSGKKTEANTAAEEPSGVVAPQEAFSLETFTRELEASLGTIQGAGKVKLVLTLEDQGKQTYQSDHRTVRSGDESEDVWETVFDSHGNGEPVLVRRNLPAFRGALVICEGGDHSGVSLGIKEAVSSLTGLGMDRITVLKME